MPAFGVWELVIILVIVVVVFGAGRLSDVGGAVGKSIREFRKATSEDVSAHPEAASPPPVAPTVTPAPLAVPPVAAVPLAAPTAVPTAVVENTCPSCATVNPTGQVFCGQCGTRLTRAA